MQVNLLVWYPANLAVHVDDPTLNLILPTSSLSTLSSTCTTPIYQRTAIWATCDFTGGGTPITGVDVTTLVTFNNPTNSPSIAIVNNYVQVAVKSSQYLFAVFCVMNDNQPCV